MFSCLILFFRWLVHFTHDLSFEASYVTMENGLLARQLVYMIAILATL